MKHKAEVAPIRRFGVAAIDRFCSHCGCRRVAAKTLLSDSRSVGASLYLVLEGSVSLITSNERGDEIVLGYLNRGELFGLSGLFEQRHICGLRVRTRGPCLLGEVSYAHFLELVRDDPELMFELARQLALRLTHITNKLRDLAFLDAHGRITRSLQELCAQPDAMTHPDGMQVRVSRTELGRLAGCSREMAGRVLKSLEHKSRIAARGKTIVVFGVRPLQHAGTGYAATTHFSR